MEISESLLKKLQDLAAVRVGEAEVAKFADQLSHIVDYLQVLSELDTHPVASIEAEGVPMQRLRDDVVEPSLPVEEILQNAPDRSGTFFRVPLIIKEEKET